MGLGRGAGRTEGLCQHSEHLRMCVCARELGKWCGKGTGEVEERDSAACICSVCVLRALDQGSLCRWLCQHPTCVSAQLFWQRGKQQSCPQPGHRPQVPRLSPCGWGRQLRPHCSLPPLTSPQTKPHIQKKNKKKSAAQLENHSTLFIRLLFLSHTLPFCCLKKQGGGDGEITF